MAKAAYLRMYMPAEQVGYFPEYVRAANGGRVMTRGAFGIWGEVPRDDAFITTHNGRRFVCPRFPRLRMLEGLVAFRNAYPGLTASLLVPERLADAAVRELESIQATGGVRSHILTSPWHVPLRWFSAFSPDEREIIGDDDQGLSIRYRTLQGDALPRLRRVVDVLDEARNSSLRATWCSTSPPTTSPFASTHSRKATSRRPARLMQQRRPDGRMLSRSFTPTDRW